jgi:hypothetical protein
MKGRRRLGRAVAVTVEVNVFAGENCWRRILGEVGRPYSSRMSCTMEREVDPRKRREGGG